METCHLGVIRTFFGRLGILWGIQHLRGAGHAICRGYVVVRGGGGAHLGGIHLYFFLKGLCCLGGICTSGGGGGGCVMWVESVLLGGNLSWWGRRVISGNILLGMELQ